MEYKQGDKIWVPGEIVDASGDLSCRVRVGGVDNLWYEADDLRPRTPDATPDVDALSAACEALVKGAAQSFSLDDPEGGWFVPAAEMDTLRAALAATEPEPAHTCDDCRWCWQHDACQYYLRRCTHPNSVIRDMEYAKPACQHFQQYPPQG